MQVFHLYHRTVYGGQGSNRQHVKVEASYFELGLLYVLYKPLRSKAFHVFFSTLSAVLSPLPSKEAEKENPPFILHVQGV